MQRAFIGKRVCGQGTSSSNFSVPFRTYAQKFDSCARCSFAPSEVQFIYLRIVESIAMRSAMRWSK
eukprot:4093194-Amphidinium_carterae.1